MKPVFYDTHAHLDFPDFKEGTDQVVQRAQAAGIARIISIGTDLRSSETAVALSAKHPCVFAAVGWHPSHVMEAPEDIRPALRKLAAHPKVVAIGETGLDYHHLPSRHDSACSNEDDEIYRSRQAGLFRQHLEVAAETGLNVVIHQRDCLEETLAQFAPFSRDLRAVFHCFVNAPEAMTRIVAMGSLVSFTGIVTFKNANEVRETLRATPDGKFMLETDAPYLAPVPYRGKRCEPAYVAETAQQVAGTRGCTLEDLSRETCATAEAFFPKLRSP